MVGALRYSLGALKAVFIWMLWGDFCATIYSVVWNNFLPLYLHDLHASNTLIAFVGSGIGGACNVLLLPNFSIWSDRHRGRWGRRIPFLFWSAPVVALSLIGMGYALDVGSWLHGFGPLRVFSTTGIALVVVVVMVLAAAISQMILVSIYQFLMRDVVPQEVMAWFLTLFRVVGVVAGSVFSWFFFRYIVAHPKILCVGAGLLFLTSFMLICWRVREGDYPPPPLQLEYGVFRRMRADYLRYFHELFSVPIYRNYVFVFISVLASNACSTFAVLFGTKTLGIGADDYGKILAAATAVSGIIYVPIGYLCQHWHAIGVVLISLALMAVGQAALYFFVWNRAGWLVYCVATALPSVGWALGSSVVTMMLFPAEKFGQFSSSLNAIGYGSLVVTSYLVGRCMEPFGDDYRTAFLISFVFFAAAIVPMARVYRGWKRHGGPDNYIPPLPKALRRSRVPVVGG